MFLFVKCLIFSEYVAPTIVIKPSPIASAVLSFGNIGGYTYDPLATFPYLQIPLWTLTTITISLGVISAIGLLGFHIPIVSNIIKAISGK